jgi:hypothetical protein
VAAPESPEILAAQKQEMAMKRVTGGTVEWLRTAVPLVFRERQQSGAQAPPLGVVVLDFSEKHDLDLLNLQILSDKASRGLFEVKLLEKIRANDYAFLRWFGDLDTLRPENPSLGVELAAAIAAEIGLNKREVEEIKVAAFLRDVGYRYLSERFWEKPRHLSSEEWLELQKHPVYSEQMILSLDLPCRICMAVRQHHEKFDGQGYPDGLNSEKISLGGRILSVADAYSALISERPYRKSFSRSEAMEMVRELSGTQFDPQVVSCLPLAIIRTRTQSPPS